MCKAVLSRFYFLKDTKIRKLSDTNFTFNPLKYLSQQRYIWESMTAEVQKHPLYFDSLPVQPEGMTMDAFIKSGPRFVTMAALYYGSEVCFIHNKGANKVTNKGVGGSYFTIVHRMVDIE